MTRRELLLSASGGLLSSAQTPRSRMSVEAYIFQQYAQRRHKKLAEVIDEIFPMTRQAGFHNIELNDLFFVPEIRDRVVAAVSANRLGMPSV